MKNKEKLHDAFGELIYVVAMADGIIQPEEEKALEKILDRHPWAKEIKWSFDYETKNQNDINFLYNKVLNVCHQYGPDPEYQYLIEILKEIANASEGKNTKEKDVIDKFVFDLTEKFKQDIDNLNK